MRIAVLTGGSRGDVQPYLALALGLQERGHSVTIATFDSFRSLVTGRGVAHASVQNPMSALRSTTAWRGWKQSGNNTFGYVYHLSRVVQLASRSLQGMFTDFWSACKGCEAIIASPSSIVGPQIAAALDARFCWALLQPMSRTTAFPHFLAPRSFPLRPRANRLSYLVAEQIFWRLFRNPINRWRRQVLNQPMLGGPGAYGVLGKTPYPVLYGFSPAVVHPSSDWGDTTHVTGYWFLDRPLEWEPPHALSAFLKGGSPPVYVGLAGINALDSDRLVRLTVDALTKTGIRGLLHFSGCSSGTPELPDSVLRIGSVPHDWLFERVSAVIHHGGAGTTAAALRAGVPSMASPVFFDQPYWGRRIASLGVGDPIPPGKLSATSLASILRRLTGDPCLRDKAATLGRQIRSENGVDRAVALLNQYLMQ